MSPLGAGVAGTLAVAACGPVAGAVLGRAPVYAPSTLASRLARRVHLRPSAGDARVAGWVMRAMYGPAWALARARLGPVRSRVRTALGLAATIFAFEELAMPALGATPPRHTWSPREHLLLGAQTLVYGFTVAAALDAR